MIKLKKKNVILDTAGSRKITVTEADWDYTFRVEEIGKSIEQTIKDNEKLGSVFKFFCKEYYPFMAACVADNCPGATEAFELPRNILDNWYMAVWELNEDIIGKPCPKKLESEEVVFRDGTKVYVYASNGLPSFILRLIELETQASENPVQDDASGQIFRSVFYPKLAGSCNGQSEVPSADVARRFPRIELYKWMEVSRRLNPDWYAEPEEAVQKTVMEKKKKVKRQSAG